MVPSIRFQTFFCTAIENFRRLFKIQYLIATHLMRWLINFYDFSFKWTATAAIGIHSTKPWFSQLVNFKNAIWTWGHFRRTICNKILFYTWENTIETYGMLKTVFKSSCMNWTSVFGWPKRFKEGRESQKTSLFILLCKIKVDQSNIS